MDLHLSPWIAPWVLYIMTRLAVSASSGMGVVLSEFLGGRLVAVGSGHMFADKYNDQEDNEKFREMLFDFLTNSHSVRFAPSDHDDIDVSFWFRSVFVLFVCPI